MEKKIKIQIPSVPNFILTDNPEIKLSLEEFSDGELTEIGVEWTKKLIERAKYIRKPHPVI